MPRKNLIRSENLPYHVTSRSHNKDPFPLPLSVAWRIAQQSFKESYAIHKIELIAFVLMNNHYHMLLVTPQGNLDSFMYEFNKRFAIKVQNHSGVINQVFGGRYKWCLIESAQYFSNCYRYVYQNPVRAMLVRRCEDYPYSTIQSFKGQPDFSIPIHDRFGFKDEYTLNWLNAHITDLELFHLKKNLSRSVLTNIKDSSKKLVRFQDPIGDAVPSHLCPGTSAQ